MEDDWEYCSESLRQVSRTFSRPIELLGELQRAVTCGYLLCRVIDTVEDEASFSLQQKEKLYEIFLAVLDGSVEAVDFSAAYEQTVRTVSPEGREGDAEHDLACSLPRVMRVLRALEPGQQRPLLRWVGEMSRGMAIYTRRQAEAEGSIVSLLSLGDLERYCYFVAGTVGHMLTDLFVQQGNIEPRRASRLRELAEDFGLGLQLVNILKDITDDRARGWSFIPEALCVKANTSVHNLANPHERVLAHRAVAPVFERAWRALDNALEYCLLLPEAQREARLFCLLPLWMAVATLKHAQGNDAQFTAGEPVKISRSEVERLIQD